MTDEQWPTIVVMCIDYRFHDQALKLIEDKCGPTDLIAVAGASKNLVSPNHPAEKHALLENIETSIKLHHAAEMVLTNHLDCGAYGGSKSFKSYEDEINFHKQELQKAKQVIAEQFPNLEVVAVFLNRDREKEVKLDIY